MATGLTKIFRLKTSSKVRLSIFAPVAKNSRGFSLFEILIVIGIIAFIMSAIIPRKMKADSAVKKVSRHLSTLARDVRNQARLKSRTFRIVFRMDGETHGYWVESAAGLVLTKSQLRLEEELRLPDDERPKSDFSKEQKFTDEEFEVPKDLYIGFLETPSIPKGLREGTGYIYFTPEGLVEAAAVQLTDRKDLTWTLIFNPLTGHVDTIHKAVQLRDIKEQ